MQLKPLMDRVVVKQVETEEVSKGGIILTSAAKAMQVKPGDRVVYSKYAGTEVKLDNEEFVILKQNDILAIVK